MNVEELMEKAEKEGIINCEGKHFKVKVTHVKFINKFDRKVDYFVLEPINEDGTIDNHKEWRSYWHLNGAAPWWLASEEEEFKKSRWYKYIEEGKR